MKIRGQHYVWRFYLSAWEKKGKLFCRRNRKIFPVSASDVAKQRDFYKLQNLTRDDVHIVKLLAVEKSPDHLKPSHLNLLATFSGIPNFTALIDKETSFEFSSMIEEAIINTEENFHGQLEQASVKYIKYLLNKDLSFLDNEDDAMAFYYFICVQYMRTKARRDSLSKMLEGAKSSGLDFDLLRVWNVLSHIFSTNMGWSLYRDRLKLKVTIFENDTDIPFIAGDQPIINTFAKLNEEETEELEFYYPLSPQLALLISKREEKNLRSIEKISREKVIDYNNLMVANATEMIFSDSRNYLEDMSLGNCRL